MIEIPEHKELILFDGVCNLCDSSIQFIIKHDKHNTFLFTPLQSELSQSIIEQFGIDTQKIDSIILFRKNEGVFYKSTAALKIASKLKFPINILASFIILPKFIRDTVYDFIARNRYTWFGKKESCMIPTPELKAKFIE
ncbi:thiol-disulfide oxidoreductase DCC family protein [Mangrovimonas sp. AS39]|uniref:thiol-disulfide oxidoreductase DCC family protein n=1 Tax=Mangrovimonas futianensis TaxID=2895523 RepID=UPI001E5A1ADC|nr:thiol-disulfide oxidoreductase DCC family protein [Mangrovimonas futianensis]MCF1191772.1 thiol-disulfide oxidoreductase DCC family protein [Mangrovimonas futianensis]MCF1195340.1 thiol-disulfide oxidoreductase DCC family protein [Mangrovimonas futianensis]